jgi:hypothetical protein
MPQPPRALVALALALILATGALPIAPPLVAPVRGVVTAPYIPSGSMPVAPGVTHDWGSMTTSRGNQNVHVVTVEALRPEIAFEAALSNDRVGSLERTTSMAARRSVEGHRVVAAVNGDVWAGTSNLMENAPNGLHVENGELMAAGPSARPTFTVDAGRVPRIGSVGVTVTMTVNDVSFVIPRLNQERRAGELALYTPRFGEQLSTAASGTEIVIGGLALPLRPTGAWTGLVTEVRPAGGGSPIDPTTVVLTAPGGALAIAPLIPGVPVTFTTTITPGWEGVVHAVGGREYLVRSGQTYIAPRPASATETHPRSAIGVTPDGRIIMATVDGRRPDESLGITLDELAELMIARGAIEAINLDGGGSTTLAVRRPGEVGAVVVNSPSDGRERAVTNGIQVVSTVPTGPLAQLWLEPPNAVVYERETIDLRAVGMDAAYNPVAVAPGEVLWTVAGAGGTIDASGRFTATTPGDAIVTAQALGVSAAMPITVVADTFPPSASAPTVGLSVGRTIGAAGVPVLVSWPAATDLGTGVAAYELESSTDGAAWVPVALPTPLGRSATVTLPRNRTYRFQLRAIDASGNAGAWAVGPAFRLAVAQETTRALTFVRGTWNRISSTSYDRVNARSTRTSGGVARFTFTGTGIAWVAARSPVRGTARVSIDGGTATTVDLHRTSAIARQMVLTKTWPTAGTHTIEIRALGTSGHPRVDIDAFVVLTPTGG